MAARLGNVLYWTACGLAVLLLVAAAATVLFGTGRDAPFIAAIEAVAAVVIWGIGLAIRYILSAPNG